MGKGGGGGGSAPQAHSVPQLGTIMGSTQTLAGYTSQLLQPLQSMFNWAADIATGGNVNPATASWPYSSVLGAGPNAQIYNPFTGLGTPGGSIFGGETPGPNGAGGQNTYQSAQFGPGGQLLSSGGGGTPGTMAATPSGGASNPQATWMQVYPGQAQQPVFQGQQITAPSYFGAAAGQTITPIYDANTQQFIGFMGANGHLLPNTSPGELVPAMYPMGGSGGQSQSAGGAGTPVPTAGGPSSLLGPFLSQAWSSIGDELKAAGMIPGLMQQTAGLTQQAENQSNQLFDTSQNLYNMATTGTGLFPSQQAFVDQGVKAQKAALAQQLNSEGLGNSTQLAQLQGEADQAGAATAGQLIQGNLGLAQQQTALAQASQKIALGGQELSLGEQAAMTQELAGISAQSSGLQQQMWTQAMQGMGMVGQMIGTALSAFGYETQAAKVQADMNVANAQIAANAQQAAQQSSGSGFSSLLGGLGSMLGGGGQGGGLLGGLGGLFGGIGGTLGAGAATGAATAAGIGGGALGSAGTVATAVIAAVAV